MHIRDWKWENCLFLQVQNVVHFWTAFGNVICGLSVMQNLSKFYFFTHTVSHGSLLSHQWHTITSRNELEVKMYVIVLLGCIAACWAWDAAYCCWCRTGHGLCVCLCLCLCDRDMGMQNDWTDWDIISGAGSCGSKEPYIRLGSRLDESIRIRHHEGW